MTAWTCSRTKCWCDVLLCIWSAVRKLMLLPVVAPPNLPTHLDVRQLIMCHPVCVLISKGRGAGCVHHRAGGVHQKHLRRGQAGLHRGFRSRAPRRELRAVRPHHVDREPRPPTTRPHKQATPSLISPSACAAACPVDPTQRRHPGRWLLCSARGALSAVVSLRCHVRTNA